MLGDKQVAPFGWSIRRRRRVLKDKIKELEAPDQGSQALFGAKMKSTYGTSGRSALSSIDRRLLELLRSSQHFTNKTFTSLPGSLQRKAETVITLSLF